MLERVRAKKLWVIITEPLWRVLACIQKAVIRKEPNLDKPNNSIWHIFSDLAYLKLSLTIIGSSFSSAKTAQKWLLPVEKVYYLVTVKIIDTKHGAYGHRKGNNHV